VWPDLIDLYIEVAKVPPAWANKRLIPNNSSGVIVQHRWDLYTFNPEDFKAIIQTYKSLPTEYKWGWPKPT
jgi:hypothetical protein